MSATDQLPEAAQPERLTQILQQAGVLEPAASVHTVAVESSRPTILSRIIRVRLSYDHPPGLAPETLILKTGLPDRMGGGWNAGRQEVAFYTQVAGSLTPPITPRCFDAHWDAQTNAWHLLLEDLTDTHSTPTTWPLPPTREQCERIVQARARFQAAFWDDPRLGISIGEWRDTDAYLQRFSDILTRFFDRFGEQLSSDRQRLYGQMLAAAPRLFARYHAHRHLTIIHGDAHVWNCFLPRDKSPDIRFFDWDSWQINICTNDLAYMMAIHWYPDRRARLEKPLLDTFHETLVSHGVSDYDRAILDDDYRLSVLWQTATPVWQAMNGIPPVIWWNNMERVMLAVDDLKCRELLDE